MGYILSLVAKKGEGNIVPYSTAKRVIEDSEADTVADFEDHLPMTIVSGKKFAENNPKTKEPFYHEIPQDEIQKRKDRSFVRYFLDGTRHIYKTGDLSIDGVIYPVSVGQIVICCCKRENRHMMHFDVRKEIVMSVPDTYCKGISTKQRENFFKKKCEEINNEIRKAHQSAGNFLLQFSRIIPYDTSRDIESGRNKYLRRSIAVIQNQMTDNERQYVADMCKDGLLDEDSSWLIKDGSLEYKRDMSNRDDDDLEKAMFDLNMKCVLGVSKSFDSELLSKIEPNIGNIIAGLSACSRTNAYRYSHEGHNYCVWYLRLRNQPVKRSSCFSDVVKVEFLINGDSTPSTVLINTISAHILNESYPVCFGKDSRWANHLYPVHVTEVHAKSQFTNDYAIINQI